MKCLPMKRPVKILHITEGLKTGGLERVIFHLATGLDRERFESTVCCLNHGGATADRIVKRGISVHIFNIDNFRDPRSWCLLYSRMKALNPDVVHAHGFFASFPGCLTAKAARIPVAISHFHTLFNPEVMTGRHRMMDIVLNRLFADRCVAVSEAVKDSFVEGEKLQSGSIQVIYNGIDGEKYPLSKPCNEKIVTVVASLTPHKNHAVVLKAFKIVRSEFRSAQLWIVGDGPLRSELEETARALGLGGSVVFKGIRNDISTLIAQSDVVVLPSTREGLSLAVMEAMAVGRPVVVSNIGGLPELVFHGLNGFLVDAYRADEFSYHISLLLRNPSLAAAMGLQGRNMFEGKFDVKIMVRKYEELYLELTNDERVRNVN